MSDKMYPTIILEVGQNYMDQVARIGSVSTLEEAKAAAREAGYKVMDSAEAGMCETTDTVDGETVHIVTVWNEADYLNQVAKDVAMSICVRSGLSDLLGLSENDRYESNYRPEDLEEALNHGVDSFFVGWLSKDREDIPVLEITEPELQEIIDSLYREYGFSNGFDQRIQNLYHFEDFVQESQKHRPN